MFKAQNSDNTSPQYSISKYLFHTYFTTTFLSKWLLISCAVGAIVGSISAGFLFSLDWVTNYRESHVLIILLLPFGGWTIGYFYHKYGKEIEPGNNLLIESIQISNKNIPLIMAPFVYLGTIITHLLGGSAGREGTALQMAAAISQPLKRVFKLNNTEQKILLVTSIAAGFGSVFGTPLAGAIFGLEVIIIGQIKYIAILPAFTSSILANLVTNYWKASHTQYAIGKIPEQSFQTIVFFILAGIIFGLCALIFSKAMHSLSQLLKKLFPYPPLRLFIGGILLIILIAALGTTKYIGLGIPTIEQSFTMTLPVYDFAVKLIFTLITLGFGYKGGEVTPLFFIGATLGNALSLILPLPIGALAGVGFVAVFAGAANTPIACILMAIELFGIEIGVFASIACIISYLVSGHNSIYQRQIIGEPKHPKLINHKGKNIYEI